MKRMIYVHIPKTAGTSIKEAIRKNKNFAYIGHNSLPPLGSDHFVVLREPIDRFWSAINYSYYKDRSWRGADRLIHAGLRTPSDFVGACFNDEHPLFYLCQKEFANNNGHTVGGKKIEKSWIYEEQFLWWRNPPHIILFPNLIREISSLGLSIPHRNKTDKREHQWSENQIKKLRGMFPNDFALWDYWSQVPFEERMNIDWSKHENPSNRP